MPVNVDAVVPARFRRAKPWEFFVRCPGGGLRWVHPSLVTSFCRENFEQKVSSMLFQGFSSWKAEGTWLTSQYYSPQKMIQSACRMSQTTSVTPESLVHCKSSVANGLKVDNCYSVVDLCLVMIWKPTSKDRWKGVLLSCNWPQEMNVAHLHVFKDIVVGLIQLSNEQI